MMRIAAIARSMSSAVVKAPRLKRTAPRSIVPRSRWTSGCAVDADADGDPEVAVKDGPHVLRVDAVDVRGEDRHVVVQVVGPVEDDARDLGQPVAQPGVRAISRAMDRLDPRPSHEVDPEPQPDDAQEVERAGLQPQRVRLACGRGWPSPCPVPPKRVVSTSRPGATTSPPIPDGPYSDLWPVNASAEIPWRRHVDRDLAGALGGVHDQRDAARRADPGDLGERLDRAEHVGGVGHDDRARVRPEERGDGVRVHEAAAVERGQVVRDDPALARWWSGRSTELWSSRVATTWSPGPHQALDRGVEGVGGVGPEDHPVGVGRAEEAGPPAPGSGVDEVARLHGEVVVAAAGRDARGGRTSPPSPRSTSGGLGKVVAALSR